MDDQCSLLDRAQQELQKVQGDPRLLGKWVRAQEDWLLEGHSLLDALERLAGGAAMMTLRSVDVRELWHSITETAFKMQWAMVGVNLVVGNVDTDV